MFYYRFWIRFNSIRFNSIWLDSIEMWRKTCVAFLSTLIWMVFRQLSRTLFAFDKYWPCRWSSASASWLPPVRLTVRAAIPSLSMPNTSRNYTDFVSLSVIVNGLVGHRNSVLATFGQHQLTFVSANDPIRESAQFLAKNNGQNRSLIISCLNK